MWFCTWIRIFCESYFEGNLCCVFKVYVRTAAAFYGMTNGDLGPTTGIRPLRTRTTEQRPSRMGGNALVVPQEENHPSQWCCLTRCWLMWRQWYVFFFSLLFVKVRRKSGCTRATHWESWPFHQMSYLLVVCCVPQVLVLLQGAEPPILCSRQKPGEPYTEVTMMTLLTSMADRELVHMIAWAKKLPGTS